MSTEPQVESLPPRPEFWRCSRNSEKTSAAGGAWGQWWEQGLPSPGPQEDCLSGMAAFQAWPEQWHICTCDLKWSLAAALTVLPWYWICNMLSTLLWINRLLKKKKVLSVGLKTWGFWTPLSALRGSLNAVASFLVFGQSEPQGQANINRSLAMPQSCWMGFPAASCMTRLWVLFLLGRFKQLVLN